jgi:hypothetical protein
MSPESTVAPRSWTRADARRAAVAADEPALPPVNETVRAPIEVAAR